VDYNSNQGENVKSLKINVFYIRLSAFVALLAVAHKARDSYSDERFVAVLGTPPVESAEASVRVQIVKETSRTK
jgi:hypothetical protein